MRSFAASFNFRFFFTVLARKLESNPLVSLAFFLLSCGSESSALQCKVLSGVLMKCDLYGLTPLTFH